MFSSVMNESVIKQQYPVTLIARVRTLCRYWNHQVAEHAATKKL